MVAPSENRKKNARIMVMELAQMLIVAVVQEKIVNYVKSRWFFFLE